MGKFFGFLVLCILGISCIAIAEVRVHSVLGANSVWTGYLETHLTFCNQRNSQELLKITYTSTLSGEARLVDVANKTLWQKPSVSSGQLIEIQIPWNQLCSNMGNRRCKNPQHKPFKIGINTNNDSLLEDFHILYIQVLDRCK